MDRELAGVVIEKWENGEAVSEKQLYKAASALGVDPMAALVEARFYTYLDNYLYEKRAMSRAERAVFSAAAGMSSGVMEKTASAHGFSPDELIVEALRQRNFVPSVEKIANLALMMQQGGQGQQGPGQPPPPGAQQQQQDPAAVDPSMDPAAAMGGQAMMQPPQDGAMLQQQPSGRFKPSPTAPEQVMASPMGNLDELVQQGQQVYGDQAMQNGGTAPQGMPEPAAPPPSPEERIQQVGPNLDPETVARYAEQLVRFEEGFQMQISDPKQMVKFVKELQKVDQGIKAMGQQLEQEQAQELGVDATPTIDGPGGGATGGPGMQMAPKGPPPQGEETSSGPPQEEAPQGGPVQAQSENDIPSAGAQPEQGGSQPPPPKKAPPQQAAQQAAVEKVAHAARVLARASVR